MLWPSAQNLNPLETSKPATGSRFKQLKTLKKFDQSIFQAIL
jgi:hypothetical protein